MCARNVRLVVAMLVGSLLAAAGTTALPNGPGKKLVEEICSFCHGLSKLKGQAHTRKEWESVTKGMISEGAPVTDEEFALILDYLEKNFGPAEEK